MQHLGRRPHLRTNLALRLLRSVLRVGKLPGASGRTTCELRSKLFPGNAVRTVLFKTIEPTLKFGALRPGNRYISGIEAIPKLADEHQAFLRRQPRDFIMIESRHETQPNAKQPRNSSLAGELRGAASVAANCYRAPIETMWRENRVNQSGSVALSTEAMRGPPWRNSLIIMALLT